MKLKHKKPVTRGFTVVELLIGLVITGILLAALAVAFNASMINYQENEEFFQNLNAARQALVRMTSQIRTGLVDPNDIANEQSCTVLCADGSLIRYYYDTTNNQLCLYDYTSGDNYVLCENVSSVAFKKDNNTSTGDVKSVRIHLTISNGDFQKQFTAAAVVRRVLE